VGRIELVGRDERELVLERWNATEREYPSKQTMVELFEEQVRRAPDAIAVVEG